MPITAQQLQYPATKRVDQTDSYFGVSVPDPYRWLEDDNSPETMKWVEAENKVTFDYLGKIPYREKLKDRLATLFNYPKYGAPFRRGEYYFFSKNDGLQNQSVIYIQKGLEGTPEVLLDPNKLSADGTSRLVTFALSLEGKYAAYTVSTGGSDWEDCYVVEVATKQKLPDTLNWLKVTGIAWAGNGFNYSRYDAPDRGKELSSKNENHKVYYHTIGTTQADDGLVFEDRANPERFHNVGTTQDERFAYLFVAERGKGKDGNALYYRDLGKGEKTWAPIVSSIGEFQYNVVDNVGDKLLIQTNDRAPNGKVMLFDPQNPEQAHWKEVLAEKPEPLQSASTGGGKLFVTYLKDVATRCYVYSLDGKLENEVKLPDLGTAGGFDGLRDDKFVFYFFTSFTYPPTIFRYDIESRKTSLFRAPEIPDYKAGDYVTEQVFFNSKDGTRVPMFIVHKKGTTMDGNNPTLLTAYGGFNITVNPSFSSLRLALLEQGFVYASANLRGGGEYGEKWHQAGMKLHKQNVFDDFIAAAEYLIAKKYTSPGKLAVQGGSNGGLLMGVVENQRPGLFKAVVTQAGVLDMLRFQKFTIGWNWIPDYGSSDNEQEFKVLYAYSPIHNIKEGTKYPATLITTADHDDRVVPAHSFKYAAVMQKKQAGSAPILIRVDTNSGHGASSTTKAIEQTADIFSFLFYNLGVTPKYPA
ncbi:MAG TPA: prolyl oligopeptidase family serine peptidase [Blastocatellia bacterium]